MENQEKEKKHKATDLETDAIENPQKTTVPEYNSTTAKREGTELPAIENLNHTEGLEDELKLAKKDKFNPSTPKNDDSLHGEETKTDLGNGQRDEDEDEDEKIIRT